MDKMTRSFYIYCCMLENRQSNLEKGITKELLAFLSDYI
jgi:hypothetical protein